MMLSMNLHKLIKPIKVPRLSTRALAADGGAAFSHWWEAKLYFPKTSDRSNGLGKPWLGSHRASPAGLKLYNGSESVCTVEITNDCSGVRYKLNI